MKRELETFLKGAKLLGKSDETWGFYQARYDEESQSIHGMITPWGIFVWVAVTMGSVNSPGEYGDQRVRIFGHRMDPEDEAFLLFFADRDKIDTLRVRSATIGMPE